MNFLKHFFISSFPFITFILLSIGVYFQFNELNFKFYGTIITSLVVLSFFFRLFLFPVARTQKNLKLQSFLIIIGVIVSILTYFNTNFFYDFVFTFKIAAGWFLYVFWFSKFEKRGENKLLVKGLKIPNFQLQKTDSSTVNIHDYLGNPLVILFYRGNWCPLCMAQIKEISNEYQSLEKMGAKVILISNQPHEYSEKLSKKFNVNFIFLVDKDNKVAQQLDLESKFGIPGGFQVLGYDSDTVLPTLIVTDKEGKIIFIDLTDNYRVRPEPDVFIKILENNI